LEEHDAFIFGVKDASIFRVEAEPLFHAGFLLGLFFDPEHRGNMFLQNG
jgi:hypothetical protein